MSANKNFGEKTQKDGIRIIKGKPSDIEKRAIEKALSLLMKSHDQNRSNEALQFSKKNWGSKKRLYRDYPNIR